MSLIMRIPIFLLTLMLFVALCGQAQTPRAKRPTTCQSDPTEITDLKADVAKMQAVLNQMQANYGLVGNPTSPANHQLQLNIDMWRILIGQMQRRVSRLEDESSKLPGPQKQSPSR